MIKSFLQIGLIALTLVLWLSAAKSMLAQGPCNNQTSVTYEGYTYDIVEIDGRCWYAENSKYLPDVSPSSQISEADPFCYVYDYDGIFVDEAVATENYNQYGVLYNQMAISSLPICPVNWTIPTTTNFIELIDFLGGASFAGPYLRDGSWQGIGTFGFDALPAGAMISAFSCLGECALDFVGQGNHTWFGTTNVNEALSLFDPIESSVYVMGSNPSSICECVASNFIWNASVSVRCVLSNDPVTGCTDNSACNFEPFATLDNGFCLYFDDCGECDGDNSTCLDDCGVPNGDNTTCLDECGVPNGDNTTCMDECGVPNGPGAIYECGCEDIPEGDCDCAGTVPVSGYDCDGNCLNDADGDGVCDEFEVLGCTDITACNYEGEATEENGSCILSGDFCNDGDFLTVDDFIQADCSCNGYGCNNPSACNYSATALHQPDLCDYESCQGCLDDVACNYSSNSTIDDGSCYYVGDSCDDGDESSFNDSVQSDCSCEGDYIGGCTYWIACNYDPDAVIDDGSCTFIGELCDDLNPLTFNDIVDENCFCGDIAITNVGEWTFSGFKVYPNPSNGMVWVEAGAAGSLFDVNVYDSASRVVTSETGIDRLKLDVSNCAPGLYLIEVNVDGSMHRTQLIIQ